VDEGRTAGRCLVAAVAGPELGPADLRALADLAPAGIVLFRRNLRSPAQTAELILGLRETCRDTILVAVDLEGGPVNRLAPLHPALSRLPAARAQTLWQLERLQEVWQAVGATLSALGFDVDFAPVVDLDGGDGGNAIGPRSYGTDPGAVTDRAAAVLRGLDAAGIAGCLKHFPGLGETDRDTHAELAVCRASQERLWRHHAQPFRRLAGEAPLVMSAHAHYPCVDGAEPLPASFSSRLMTGWLRERIGFEGLLVSDDLEMGAISGALPPGERALRTLAAGADLALFCRDLDAPRRARDRLAEALVRGELDPDRRLASERRLARLLDRLPRRAGGSAFTTAASRLEQVLA